MKKLNKILIVLFIFKLNNTIYAQGPGDPGGDPGATPITDYIPLMIVIAVVLAYVLIHKKTKKIVN